MRVLQMSDAASERSLHERLAGVATSGKPGYADGLSAAAQALYAVSRSSTILDRWQNRPVSVRLLLCRSRSRWPAQRSVGRWAVHKAHHRPQHQDLDDESEDICGGRP
jgi:hypothetical protein